MYHRYDSPRRGGNRPRNAPKPIAGVVENLIASLGLTRRYHGWMTVQHWPEIVGEQVAKVARAIRFEDGILYVAVPGDAWRQELAMQIDSILDGIHARPYGRVVTQIRLVRGEKGTR